MENPFNMNAGSYDPTGLTTDKCMEACSNLAYTHAATSAGTICMCGNPESNVNLNQGSSCTEPCSGKSDDQCGSADGGQYSVSSVASASPQLSSASVSVAVTNNIDNEVSLQITSDMTDFEYSYVDCFWGHEIKLGNTKTFTIKSMLARECTVTVFANATIGPPVTLSAMASFNVTTTNPSQALNITCTEYSSLASEFECDVTIFRKYSSQLLIKPETMSDITFGVPDTTVQIIGYMIGIKGVLPENYQQGDCSGVVLLANHVIDQPLTFIVGFQMYAATTGVVKLKVFEPQCSTNTFCPSSKTCEATPSCSSDYEHTCSVGTWWCPQCKSHCSSSGTLPNFVEVYTVDATITSEGHFHYKLPDPLEVKVGSVVGFEGAGGCLMSRSLTGHLSDTNSAKTSLNKRHLFQALISTGYKFTQSITYNTPGKFEISVEIDGAVDADASKSADVTIQGEIKDLEITCSQTCVGPNQLVDCSVTVSSGSLVTLIYDFGDNTPTITEYIQTVNPGDTFKSNHTYTAPGVYQISVNASNLMKGIKNFTEVIIQNLVTTNVEISSNSPQLYPPGDISFNIVFHTDPVPTNASMEIQWCSEKPTATTTRQVAPGESNITIANTYSGSGSCSVVANISNDCNYETFNTQVELIHKILGTEANIFGKESSLSCPLLDIVSVNKSLSFLVISPIASEVEKYVLQDDAGTVLKEFTGQSTNYSLTTPGKHELRLYSHTMLQKPAGYPTNFSLTAMKPVGSLSIFHDGAVQDLDVDHHFTVTITELGSRSCLKVDYGDNSVRYYGNIDDCETFYITFVASERIGNLEETSMVLSHSYATTGTFSVTLTLSNCLKTETTSVSNIIVGKIPCSEINFWIEDVMENDNDCLLSSKPIILNVKSYILCEDGEVNMDKNWEIKKINEPNKFIELPDNNKSTLTIPPNTLNVGYYAVNFTAELTGLPIRVIFDNSSSFCTKLSPLEAQIIDGISSEITLGENQFKMLDPAAYSRDPNSPERIKNPIVILLCRKSTEDFPFNVSLIKEPFPLQNRSLAVKSANGDQGGCFGDGLFAIMTTLNGSHLVDTNAFIHNVGTYVFTAVIGTCAFDTCRHAVASMTINLELGTPPIIVLDCNYDHKCSRRMIDGKQTIVINANDNIGMNVKCLESCPYNAKFRVTVFSFDKGQSKELNVSQEELSVFPSATQADINLNREFYLKYNTTMKFGVIVEFDVSKNKLNFLVNRNPINGSCWIHTPVDCMLPSFFIKCDKAWIDPDGGTIVSYLAKVEGPEFFFNKRVNNPMIECYISKDTIDMASVDVIDSDGGITTVVFEGNLTEKICRPNISSSDWMTGIKNQGDPEKINAALVINFDKLSAEVDSFAPEYAESDSSSNSPSSIENAEMLAESKYDAILDTLDILEASPEIAEAALDTLTVMCTGNRSNSEVADKCNAIMSTFVDVNAPFDPSTYEKINNNILNAAVDMLNQEVKLVKPEGEVDNEETFGNAPPNPKASKKLETKSDAKKASLVVNMASKWLSDAIKDDATGVEKETEAYKLNVFKVPAQSYGSMSGNNVTGVLYVVIMAVKGGLYGKQKGSDDIINPKECTVTQSAQIGDKPLTGSDDDFNITVKIPRNDLFSLPPGDNATLTKQQTSVPHRCAIEFYEVVLIKFVPPENVSTWFLSIGQVGDPKNSSSIFESSNMRKHVGNESTPVMYSLMLMNSTYPDLFASDNDSSIRLDIQITVLKDTKVLQSGDYQNVTSTDVLQFFSYGFSCCTIRCGYFDVKEKKWKTSGIEVAGISEDGIACQSNHLTTFGSGFFVKPNMIDFDYVFENASFTNNLTIYLTIIVSFVLYILLLIWGHRQDKKDVEKIGATPLPDNKKEHKYLYEILVFTGSKSNSGTESKVHFVLSGDNAETKTRCLEDTERKVLQKNSIDSFIMTTPGPLGNLKYLRIWHDNSGKGKKASWYLKFIVIRDVQTKKKYEFLAHRWFAVELDDGAIDRMLPVSGKEELSEFSHLFSASSTRNLRDGHLWLSVFLRPPRSRFTRVQRVSSCMALLYLSMLVNIMWYRTAPDKPASGLKFGPFVLSPAQVGVGIISNLIVFPPSLIIITLFRKSRRRHLRPSRITEAIERQNDDDEDDNDDDDNNGSSDTIAGSRVELTRSNNKSKNKPKIDVPKKFTFPWWCVYIAWALTIICIGISIFFLWAYGIQFGNDKTTKWFSSLVISFVCSVMLTQPIKVILITLVVSMICKDLNQDEDDVDDDEEEPELASDEEWMHFEGKSKRKMLPSVLNSKEMMKAREQREKEVKMYAIAREILSYLLFLWILLTISYGNRDPNAILLRTSIENAFLKPGDKHLDFLAKVRTPDKLYHWMKSVFVKEIITGNWYNGQPPFGLQGYINDQANYLISIPILRQVRVKKNSCSIHPLVWEITDNCGGYGKLVNEQSENFREYWTKDSSAKKRYEFEYQSMSTLKSLPFWGMLDWYTGGGYVCPMVPPLWSKTRRLLKQIDRLNTTNWIDKSTRAVFVEFAIHNAQVNLFASVAIVAEFQPGGGIIPYHRINIMRLQRYHTDFGLFIFICEIFFVLFILYFTFLEAREIYKERKAYFKQLPNFIDMSLVLISYFGIGLFIQRDILTADIIKVFKETKGKGYVRLQHAAAVDEVLGYMIAFLVFLANLKFLHLLRFNKRLGILSTTLKECAAELSSFGVCLLIVFLSFVQLFYLILGIQMADYATFINALEATFSMMLGKFKFHEIQLTAPFLGPLVFFVFGLATTLVLINILLTIVIRTFEEVKRDMTKQPNDYEMVEFILNRVRAVIGFNKKLKVHPEDETNVKKDDTQDVKDFSNKVDKLLGYINNVYIGQNIKPNAKMLMSKRRKPEMAFKECKEDEVDYHGI